MVFFSFLLFGDITQIKDIISGNRNNLTFGPDGYPTLSEVINFLITGYSIIITAIFSFVIWKTSVRSYEVAEAVKSLEEKRDMESIRQSALIVYYELLTGFTNLRDLYISIILENKAPNPNRLFFSEDWVKNISLLRDRLDANEINEIHRLYNKFLTIKGLLETDSESEKVKLRKYIGETMSQTFTSFLSKEFTKNEFGSVTKYLEIDYFIILSKIRFASYAKVKIENKYNAGESIISINKELFYVGSISDNLFDGYGILHTDDGLPKYEGVFKNGRFVSGKAKEYYDSGEILYEIEYKDGVKRRGYMAKLNSDTQKVPYYFNGEFEDDEIVDGIVTLFRADHSIYYEGGIKSRKYSGYGIRYENGKKLYEGTFKEGHITQGVKFTDPVFEGEFKQGKPWNGSVKGLSDNLFVRKFYGQLVNGQPYKGEGLIFQKNHKGDTRDYLEVLEDSKKLFYDEIVFIDETEINDREERQQDEINKNSRESYGIWDDFIKADWVEGNVKEREDKEGNKVVYFNANSKV